MLYGLYNNAREKVVDLFCDDPKQGQPPFTASLQINAQEKLDGIERNSYNSELFLAEI